MTLPINSHATEADLKRAADAVLQAHPDLSVYGWHGNPAVPLDHPLHYATTSYEVYKCAPKARDRERFDMEELRTALRFLETFAFRRKTFNKKFGSYGLKHRVEVWGYAHEMASYIANGAFILAAMLAGFKYKRSRLSGPNCIFNIGFVRGFNKYAY